MNFYLQVGYRYRQGTGIGRVQVYGRVQRGKSSVFSTLPSTQTIKVIGLIFFLRAGHEKLGYEHGFQPYTFSLRPSSRGAPNAPPQAIHRFRPPAFIGLITHGTNLTFIVRNRKLKRMSSLNFAIYNLDLGPNLNNLEQHR